MDRGQKPTESEVAEIKRLIRQNEESIEQAKAMLLRNEEDLKKMRARAAELLRNAKKRS